MLPEFSTADARWQERVLHRPVCELLGCRLPLVLAGMGGVARVELAVAAAQAGGFGVLGMAREPVPLIREEVAKVRAGGVARFGVNLIPSATDPALLAAQLDACIALKVPVLGLFREVAPALVRRAVDAGMLVVHQVGSAADARAAEAAGAGVIVVQGVEAGGHLRGGQPLLQLLPEVLAVVQVPVLAAGGIADGIDVATLLALGAQGAMLGTPLMATHGSGVGRVHDVVGAGERLQRIAAQAAQLLRTAASEPPAIELSSPVCYAREFELMREDAIERPALRAALDELLEGARAGVRLSLPQGAVADIGNAVAEAADDAASPQARLAGLHREEVKWCGMLAAAIDALGATPSTRTGSFFVEAAGSIADPGDRLAAMLRRRQEQAAQLRSLLRGVTDERLADGLGEMLAAYERA